MNLHKRLPLLALIGLTVSCIASYTRADWSNVSYVDRRSSYRGSRSHGGNRSYEADYYYAGKPPYNEQYDPRPLCDVSDAACREQRREERLDLQGNWLSRGGLRSDKSKSIQPATRAPVSRYDSEQIR